MAISVNTVYQTVQRFLNIEQRGQLPPSDFNHFGNVAQLDLLNMAISDMAHFKLNPKGSDRKLMDNLQAQINVFMTSSTHMVTDELPSTLHTLVTVTTDGKVVEDIDHTESPYVMRSSLTGANVTFPKYNRVYGSGSGVGSLNVFPSSIDSVDITYIRKPTPPIWNSVNIQNIPVFNQNSSTDFELHNSREDDLIMKILLYAGVSTRQQDIAAFAASQMQQEEQSEKQ